ncbi:hypothetical protein PVAP13_5NG433981 [Panicum virgatum]|uniref:Uncharacterized protein n=1 Tax=Panicum virgatum TaxID=38727 RepID=A0A8T0RQZ1_PANVG|nr:hypothetical protein PVAP13_5NG433981 [Panicum virgatum]
MGVPGAGGSCSAVLATTTGTAAVFLLLVLCGCGAPAAMAAAAGGGGGGGGGEEFLYKDPRQPQNRRIDDLLRRMTLAEKIGQMSQIERENATADVVRGYFVGSVVSGGGSVPAPQAPAEAWVNMVNGMQRAAMSTRLGIPMLYGIDAVHGHGNVYKATVFPHNVGLGCTRDPELVKKIGAATALEVRATGIPYVFAPCVAVCRDPRWGRCYESFSEDPKLVQQMTSVVSGLQGEIPAGGRRGALFVAGQRNVAACSKHYVGDGGTARGINENDTVASFHELLAVHMPPYYSAVIRGVSTVMVSFSSWNGVKMHANHFLVTDFLKTRLRFRGFVISDWRGLDKMTSPEHANYITSVKLGILAGIDMVTRIAPFTMGLFESPYGDPSLAGELGKAEHRELAREAVRRSLVLLKNGKDGEGPLLPLPKKAGSILVAGSHADNLGYQCGGWTITWQGEGGNNLTALTTILDGIRRAVGRGTEAVYSENPDAGFVRRNAGRCDYAVVIVGEPPYAESFGNNLNLTVPAPGPGVIRAVCGGGIRCAVVLVSGRPLAVESFVGAVDALVAAWLPGTEGQGVSDVLFGDYGFTGKLARTWFRSVEQLPMNAGDAHYDPLFPFGFGLETEPSTA